MILLAFETLINNYFTNAEEEKIKPEEGLLVAVNLSDEKYGLAQVVKTKGESDGFISHVTWFFFNVHANSADELSKLIQAPSQLSNPFLICGMTYEELEKGLWPVIGKVPVKFDNLVITDGLIKTWQKEEIAGAFLLEMFWGIVPWNSYKDPEYIDKHLLPGYSRPESALLK